VRESKREGRGVGGDRKRQKYLKTLQGKTPHVVARKSQYPIKSSTDLHMELMMLFYEAKQASSVVEVGSKSPLQMLEFV